MESHGTSLRGKLVNWSTDTLGGETNHNGFKKGFFGSARELVTPWLVHPSPPSQFAGCSVVGLNKKGQGGEEERQIERIETERACHVWKKGK